MNMASRKTDANENIKPPPPSNISKEKLEIWVGWSCMGDREVAREAATKGSHIELALDFLAERKKIEIKLVSEWFKNEILIWVDELLNRKQIFRATHILNNINADPIYELKKKFLNTTNTDLRKYIGENLKKQDKLEDDVSHLWDFLEMIIGNYCLLPPYYKIKESIDNVMKQDENWKNEVASVLFFKIYDNRAGPFLNADVAWKYLLRTNDTKLLKIWINFRYNKNYEKSFENIDVKENLKDFFKSSPITNEMLNILHDNNTFDNTRNIILNEFSQFGIFCDSEKNDVMIIIKRINESSSIMNIFSILSKRTSSVSLEVFIEMLSDYCLEREYYSILNACLKNLAISDVIEKKNSKHLRMIHDFRYLITNFFEETLRNNIYNVSYFLSFNDDVTTYLKNNPLIIIALQIFTKDASFIDIVSNQTNFIIKEINLNEPLRNATKKLHILNAIYNKKICNTISKKIITYDLLMQHSNMDVEQAFNFRFNNSAFFPHFNEKSLVEKYGYSKDMFFIFDLKQCRPSIASRTFIIGQLKKHGLINESDLKYTIKKTFKFALLNFTNIELCISCFAFLEMIGVNSNALRTEIIIAKLFLENFKDETEVCKMFIHPTRDCYVIQDTLENILISKINFTSLSNSNNLINAIKLYEIVIVFSLANNLKLPEKFLKQCASNNLWLPFLMFVQIYRYDNKQVKELVQNFTSPILLEHINHSIMHDITYDDSDELMRERDSRKNFLSRIGVRQTMKNQKVDPMYCSITSQSSAGSTLSSTTTNSETFEIDILNTKATLLQTLIRCHNSTDPPKALLQACQLYRNPLLAIFAMSYEPDSIITNWLTWLAVSCECCETFTNYETIAMCSTSVTNLLENCLQLQYPVALSQSFKIFIPENPLNFFMDFLCCLIKMNLDVKYLTSKLTSFSNSMKNTRRNSILTDTDHEMTYLTSRVWIEKTALKLLAATLHYNIKSFYDQIQVLESLCELHLQDLFKMGSPKFCDVLKIFKILFDSECYQKMDITKIFEINSCKGEIIQCIERLLDKHFYDTALKIAKIQELPVDLILTKEWENKFNNAEERDKNFWFECNNNFKLHNVTADCIIEFYQECLININDKFEVYEVLQFCCEWAIKFDLSNQYDLEKQMWLIYLDLEEKHKILNIKNLANPLCLYNDILELLQKVPGCDVVLNEQQIDQLQKIIIQSLNVGNFLQAVKIEKMFNIKNTDLEILKLCHSLAENILLPHQLNTDQRSLLMKGNLRRFGGLRRTLLSTRKLSFSSHSLCTSSMTHLSDTAETPIEDTLAILLTFTDKLSNGVEIANKIAMTYRISLNIEIPYTIIVSSTDSLKMLKDALEDDCMNKLEVVHDFIKVYQWSIEEIADFMCEGIVNATSGFIHSKSDKFIMWDLNLDEDFHLILQLLQDNCSVLGYQIYAYASTLHKAKVISDLEFNENELALISELLIRAHDCFTADCNMEGISIILKKSQKIIMHLLALNSWSIMVRLFTGVGRYTEMVYVFHILRENDQFEYLLRKGSRKDNSLKVALLDYLKKFCPDNKNLYKIVALHFTLFSEVAQLWEREAEGIIKNLIAISKLEMQNNKLNPDTELFVLFTNTDGTRICLNKSIENYTHATEFHLKGEKLAKAMNSAKQAELIALQLSLLKGLPSNGTTTCILHLNNIQINLLITTKLSFIQSYILVESYNYQADWSQVLYEQYILQNNPSYLEHLLQYIPLTETLVQDVSRRFINANINTACEINRMKDILNKVLSVHIKYRIASELGFTDLVEDLINGGQLAYLKDTVWKRGYKN